MIILIALLIFPGCSKENTVEISEKTKINTENFKLYGSEEFAIRYPKGWAIETKMSNAYPKSTLILFINKLSEKSFKENINIDKRELKTGVDNLTFAQNMLSKNESDLIGFQKIAEQNIKIKIAGEEKDTIFAVFEGRNKRDGDKFRFLQVYAVKDTIGYIATATILANSPEEMNNTLSTSVKSLEIQ